MDRLAGVVADLLGEEPPGPGVQAVLQGLRRDVQGLQQANARLHQRVQQLEAVKPPAGPAGLGFDLPAWAPGIHRTGTTVQHHLGQCFEAVCDTTEEPGSTDDWRRVGTAGFRHTGGYEPGRTYSVGDLVQRDYSTFVCTPHGLQLLAARGPRGEAAVPGAGPTTFVLKGSKLLLQVDDAEPLAVDLLPLLEALGEAVQESVRAEVLGAQAAAALPAPPPDQAQTRTVHEAPQQEHDDGQP